MCWKKRFWFLWNARLQPPMPDASKGVGHLWNHNALKGYHYFEIKTIRSSNMKRITTLAFFACLILSISCNIYKEKKPSQVHPQLSPLEKYVAAPDTAFRYELRSTLPGKGYTTYVLYLQSQRWLSEKEVKNPLWWHWLTIVVPDEVKGGTGLLYIGEGSRKTELPTAAHPIILQSALATHTITAAVHNVPNQPVEFTDDDFGPRVEDELIAHGWRQYLDGGGTEADSKWLARLPMTKAAVRAMDAVQQFCKEKTQKEVSRFTVIGASKRGWATWTTAIADDRVVAIAPVVIDLLNVVPSFQHHWQAYGFWAPAVSDYVREGIMDRQNTAAYQRLIETVEPYTFRKRLDLPKFLINAASDQFFLPDSWQFYWNGLVGEKHLRYVPNAGHSLSGSDAIESFVAFYHAIVNNEPRPDFDWKTADGNILINTDPQFQPDSIWLWQTANRNARDFRKETIGTTWTRSPVEFSADGKYKLDIEKPAKGYAAFFVELVFVGDGPVPFKFTTGVVVRPEEMPFGDYNTTK
ncbi:MAG TPA: PhoPQ-activated pathogenicity-like protein PqaA type [Bacteroidetes bacterium]|nr:PhoPQ-activated pathogenicity-like protein PqaA type [Bacteroidota bacterium]